MRTPAHRPPLSRILPRLAIREKLARRLLDEALDPGPSAEARSRHAARFDATDRRLDDVPREKKFDAVGPRSSEKRLVVVFPAPRRPVTTTTLRPLSVRSFVRRLWRLPPRLRDQGRHDGGRHRTSSLRPRAAPRDFVLAHHRRPDRDGAGLGATRRSSTGIGVGQDHRTRTGDETADGARPPRRRSRCSIFPEELVRRVVAAAFRAWFPRGDLESSSHATPRRHGIRQLGESDARRILVGAEVLEAQPVEASATRAPLPSFSAGPEPMTSMRSALAVTRSRRRGP